MSVLSPISPGISPGAAAPLVRAGVDHPINIFSIHAAIGFCGLSVHEEIHLFTPDLFQMSLEGIHSSYFDRFSRQTIPPVHNSFRKEVQSGITTTM